MPSDRLPPELRVYLTGGVRIEVGDVLVDHRMFSFERSQLVLAYFFCERRRPVAAAELAALLGAAVAADEPTAIHAIAEKLRRALSRHLPNGAARLVGSDPYELQTPTETWVDIEAAAAAIHDAEAELRSGRPTGAFGPSAIAHHIAKRPFLPGEQGRWVESQRERLSSILVRALECRGEVFLWNREVPLAIEAAKEIVALEPFRETAYQLLIRAHAALGNAAEASSVYERFRATLATRLGVEPSPRTQAVYRDAVRQTTTPSRVEAADRLPPARPGSDLIDELTRLLGSTYRIERELSGGMSRVFVAEDLALERRVVIKVLRPDTARTLSAERFAREVRLAAKLQQANIVPVLSAGTVGGIPYYTMPFVSGESLRLMLETATPLPPRRTIEILRDVARALAFAHEHGVVHRDIKPENILLSGSTAVVTDFGIAKAMQEADARVSQTDTAMTTTGMVVGTPHYMAPEQIAGDPATDHRADIYSFGVVAYELLAGRSPFGDRSAQAAIVAHLQDQPRDIRQVRPETPHALASMVMHCLSKAPGSRPPGMSHVLTALE